MRILDSLLLVAATTSVTSTAATQNWSLVNTPGPAGATFPRMAYDSQRSRCVMFGGWNAPLGTIVFDDTWEYDGLGWTLRNPATVPDERDSHVMAYDSARGRTVMFGGWDFNFVYLGQTWEWNGTNWFNVMPLNAPSARLLAAMAFDSGRGVTVLFGGQDLGGRRNDTWEWNGINWVQRAPAQFPSARTGHAIAYDSVRARTVLFGGNNGLVHLRDTWEYDGNNWALIATDGPPPARVEHQLVFDTQRARVVLFGGADTSIDRNDTWEYDGRGWRELFTFNRPLGNSAMSMAYDSARGRTVVFGGYHGTGAIDDTWELGGAAATWRTFGTGCVGSNGLPPRVLPIVMPALGATARLDVMDLPAGGGFVYVTIGLSDQFWGALPLPVILAPVGLTGCRGYTSADFGSVLSHLNGIATWTLPVPSNPSLGGIVFFLQALSLDAAAPRPFPGALSNAAEMNVR